MSISFNRLLSFLLLAALATTSNGDSKAELQKKAEAYRLPDTVIPENYVLNISELNFENFHFGGTVQINATVVKKTNEIVLHHGKISANVVSVKVLETGKDLGFKPSYNETTEKWNITLSTTLNETNKISITASFTGTLRNDMIGFYKSSYIDDKGNERWLAATQFQATHARHAFPCFDEPALKATFSINISPPKGYRCLSNMPLTMNSNRCEFKKSVKMSTYLVAFIISDFESQESKSLPMLNVWSRPNALKQTQYSADIGAKALKYFSDLFKKNYEESIPKMDMVAVPDFSAGAMENWGLITYRETAMLYDEKDSPAASQQRVGSVIVHECTHMWFGNLVTPDWWSYLWLSEAFARYYQYIGTNQIEPDWKMDQQFVVEQHQLALGVDALDSSEAMTRPAYTQAEIGKMGGSITYSKGASIVRMMELTFGSDVFNAALRKYISKRAYTSATPDDLWKAFEGEVKIENLTIKTIMESWTAQAGFPYIYVNIQPDSITVTQERFLLRDINKVPSNPTWSVPITWISLNKTTTATPSTKPVFWLNERSYNYPHKNKDELLIFNVHSAGFYRVNYDDNSWNKIIQMLMSDNFERIPEINRAAIVDDLLNLARAGFLDYDIALRGIQYLRRETNYLPFKSAFTALDYLIRKFSSSPDYEIVKRHVLALCKNIYEKLTFDDKEGDDRLTILLREEINNRACSLDHTKCVSKSLQYFNAWKNTYKPISKNQRSAAYCTAIKYGNDEDWNFMWEQYKISNVAVEQTQILSALGCSKNTSILENYLLNSLKNFNESYIRKQDVSSVFSSVYSSSVEGAEYMLEFVDKHHATMFNYHGSYAELGNLISGALQKYPSKKLVTKVKNIMNSKAKYVESIKSSLEKTIESATFELGWHEKYADKIIDWIKINDPAISDTIAYRLPKNVIPSAYAIRLTPHIPKDFTFSGSVNISATVKEKTSKIVLHANQLEIQNTLVSTDKGSQLKVSKTSKTDKYHFYNIDMKNPIEANTKINIEMNFTGILNSEMLGFYRSSYQMNNKTRWLAATHLEPVGARKVFPCFDEPALKATFDISVEVPENYHAISNMDLKEEPTNGLWKFKTTPLMSTYLVALIVSDFQSKSVNKSENNHLYRVWSNPLVAHQLNYSLEVMPPIVKFFEKNLGIDYSLPKMDMVALPDFSSGAMENWGLLTYRETSMLYDSQVMSSLAAKQSIRNVIAHEIAHQWFGNLVSPQLWDYLWLSEGFARYFQYHAYTEAEASWDLESQFVVDHLQTSFTNDASTSTHPITHEVYSPSKIKAIFDKISYAKAGSIIRMVEKLIGRNAFYQALNKYLANCRYSTGTPEALFEAFQNEISYTPSNGFNVKAVMNSWTKQSGFPVVNVSFNNKTVTFSQNRFYLRSPKDEIPESVWHIPINYATRSQPDFNTTTKVFWLLEKTKTMELPRGEQDWIIFNLQQTGYYRVNYDKNMWQQITEVLDSDNYKLIHQINRASLIDDMLNLARVDLLSYDVALAGLRYLRRETDYGPWKAAYTGFQYISRRFAGRPEVFTSYRAYLFRILELHLDRLGFKDTNDKTHTETLLQKLVLEWLCSLDHDKCVTEANKLFQMQVKNQSYSVSPNQHAFVYCTAIRHGTSDDWDFLWNKFVKSNYATEKLTILTALACSKNVTKLNNLLLNVINPESGIKLQDAKKLFTSVIDATLVGVETTLSFIENNFEKMQKYFNNDSTVKSLISTISKRVSTEKLFEKFTNFVKSGTKTMPSIVDSLQSSLKRATVEMNWYKKHGPTIHEWLEKNSEQSNYRLPTFAKPNDYKIYITPYIEENNFTFDGQVFINLNVMQNTHMIVLHAHDMSIKKINVTDKVFTISSYSYNQTTQKLSIHFDKLIEAGKQLELRITYVGNMRDDMRGFYRSHYTDENGQKRWIASTHFEPAYARRAFPCFDEPSFKANFTIHISKPKGYHTLSNMGSSPKQRIDSDGREWDEYEKSVTMSPYLVAFVVSDFIKVPENTSFVSVWARPQLKRYLNYAPVTGSKAIKLLQTFTKIDYPLNEMNFVALPDFDMGAMENWGLITYREYGLTFDQSMTSATYKKYVTTVISHELVHQWFGNLVTCEWWDYTWLNEGFAEYLSYIISNSIEPDWQLLKQFVVSELHVALNADSSASAHAMNNKVLTPTEAQDGFDKIAYQKSASILRMLHHSFGKKAFEDALHDYLDKHKYSTGRPEFLIAAINNRLENEKLKVPGNLEVDIPTVMNSWILQPGYPVISAKRSGNDVTLSQERFLVTPDSSASDKKYWIPITYTTNNELNFTNTVPRLWLGDKQMKINLNSNDSWYLLNMQQIGYYRVNYEDSNWEHLIQILNSDKFETIDEINRAQILDDLLNLARAGYVDYSLALNATRYLVRETNYLPWRAFFTSISYIGQKIEGQETNKKLYSEYILKLLDGIYKKLSFKEDMVKDAHLDQLNRELVLSWACTYGHEDCIKQSKAYFNQTRLTPNIAGTVYCTVIAHGSSTEWDVLWKKFTEATLATDYIVILKGLGCSKDTKILQKYLDLIIAPDSKIRKQDVATAFSSIYASSQIGLETAFNYFKNNLPALYEYYGRWNEVGSLFNNLASRISTQKQLDDLETFANTTLGLYIKTSLNTAIQTATNNLKWNEKYVPGILKWLKVDAEEAGKEEKEEKEENGKGSATNPTLLSFGFLISICLSLYL